MPACAVAAVVCGGGVRPQDQVAEIEKYQAKDQAELQEMVDSATKAVEDVSRGCPLPRRAALFLLWRLVVCCGPPAPPVHSRAPRAAQYRTGVPEHSF